MFVHMYMHACRCDPAFPLATLGLRSFFLVGLLIHYGKTEHVFFKYLDSEKQV